MNKLLLGSFLMMFCYTVSVQAADDLTRLKHFAKNINTYDRNYTQEKVYLHLDNNGYFPNEKIWYKAYVFKAGTLLPTDMSKVLYVELVTPTGEVKERQTLPIYNGRTYGDFSLKDIFQTGYYEIRAYTRAMLNWDNSYIYSRVIPIFNIPEDTTQFSKLSLFQDPVDDKLIRKRPLPSPMLNKYSQKEGKLILTFYPEGGHITKGIPGRVAYKLTDNVGRPFNTILSLFRSNGTEILKTHPLHEGMGLIELPADWTGGFVKATDSKGKEQLFNLPQQQERGCQMEVNTDTTGNVIVKITPHDLESAQLLGLTTTCRGQLFHFDTLNVYHQTITKKLERKFLHNGIHQITLFTPEGNILAERLIWVEPLEKPLIFEVKQNQELYKPFSPVVLDFLLKDSNGHPEQSEFSLSVQDVGGMVGQDGMSLKTDMLLCSDLKGYIHQPEYYFEKKDEEHRQAINLLLMVQGWRRYEWKQMAGVDSFQLKQPVEDAQILDGKIGNFSKDHDGKAGLNVNLVLLDGKGLNTGTTRTDSTGCFAMKFQKEIYGEKYGYFIITKDKDKKVSSDILLNRTFRPSSLAYDPQQLYFEKPVELRHDINMEHPDIFAWKDTITSKNIHALPAAKIKAGRLSPFIRYQLDAEEAAREEGSLFYNIEDEMEQMRDKGTLEVAIWDWLKKRNAYFDYEAESTLGGMEYTLFYHQKKVALIIDNQFFSTAMNYKNNDCLGSDFKTLVICKNSSVINKLYPQVSQGILRGNYSPAYRPEYFFILTTSAAPQIIKEYQKGRRATLIHGYSKAEDFYSPNYRTEALPDPTDMRRTLYWNPVIETDKNGKARITLFSNSRPNQQIHINAQGIAVNGEMFSTQDK